ncbi:AI-2E family transporter [Cognatishimia sp. F0-27]|uniref:AI-2E family transporter n=1 Tax=Cognatishimia sp. F0-27 TaxID=2816855 RepID=UPI001D0C4FB5|nr:AI-2E family transporter [Cognatishimia sp. F0-27]MCC1493887.1 AI-2E family transporter [Cognatishimia sp. F0-27]
MGRSQTIRLSLTRLQSLSILCLGVIAVVAALRVGQSIFAPVLLGLTIGVILTPMMRLIDHAGLPNVFGALSALVIAFVVVAMVGLWAGPIMVDLINALPRLSNTVGEFVAQLSWTLRGLEQLESGLSASGEDAVKDAMPSMIDALWLAPNIMGQALITAGTLFFFLLTREDIYAQLRPFVKDRLKTAERAVSYYFTTISLVNAALGISVATVLSLLGMADPMVWGAAAFLLNFAVYLGPAIMVVALLVGGLLEFHGAMALAPPAAFLILNMIEAQFVTPSVVGQQLSLNPLILFLAIVFGLWLWGPVGGIVALPLLVWIWALIKGIG